MSQIPPLLALPPELIYQIISSIPSPSTLLRLALTCHILAYPILSTHLPYRDLLCPLYATPLWSRLSLKPALAKNVRRLLLGFHPRPLAPPGISLMPLHVSRPRAEWLKDARGELVTALGLMSGLESFQWYGCDVPGRNDEVWEALARSCPNLRELVVRDWCHCDFNGPERPIYESKLFSLTNLTTFKLHCTAYRAFSRPPDGATAQLLPFLLASPHLVHLDLTFIFNDPESGCTPLDDVFGSEEATWPDLRVLHLGQVSCGPEAAVRFLARHPRLEELSIALDWWGKFNLSRLASPSLFEPILPNLHTFGGTYTSLLHLSRLSPFVPPLRTLRFDWRYEEEYARLAGVLPRFADTLERICVSAVGEDERYWGRALEAVPGVTIEDGRVSVRMAEDGKGKGVEKAGERDEKMEGKWVRAEEGKGKGVEKAGEERMGGKWERTVWSTRSVRVTNKSY